MKKKNVSQMEQEWLGVSVCTVCVLSVFECIHNVYLLAVEQFYRSQFVLKYPDVVQA